ncbi:hypothetical protein H2248_004366 [Termitomyces sp. 'cryptogamus']|nr:hypothetical protein H2248_004366 [Termitomyces sp. 'cryptogamus']
MSNGSPTAYLLWAILSCIVSLQSATWTCADSWKYLVFLLLHLWCYDRFTCLRWNAGRQPGAFKRVMTYSYLATVPLLVLFSVAITALKFREGFSVLPDGTITPVPFSMWSSRSRRWVLPLDFILSVAWSLEHVTHLEELTFWVFLLTQGPGKREWFDSWEFRLWTFGSISTVAGMPITVLATRFNIDTCLAYIFLVGSAVGTTTTLCFLYVLARFPWFITYVKAEGAEPDVVIRLATFYQLNLIRVAFRFLFTLPLMVIAIDALHKGDHHPIINDPFAADFLLMMGAIGCTVSSAITLLIFFPRSITRESGYKTKVSSYSPSHSRSIGLTRISSNHLPMYQYHEQDQQYSYHYRDEQMPEPKPYTPTPLHPDEYEDGGEDEFYVYPETEDGEGEEFEGSLVSPTSPSGEGGYDPDINSVPRIHVRLYGEQGQGEREGSVTGAVSSDDTVWDRGAGADAGADGGSGGTSRVHSHPSAPTPANMGWGRQAQLQGKEGSGEQRRRSLSLREARISSVSVEPVVPFETQTTNGHGDSEQDVAKLPEQVEQRPSPQLQLQSPTPSSPRAHRQREPHRVSSGKTRRHHSGGPFFFDGSGRLVGPTHARAHAIREEDLGEGGGLGEGAEVHHGAVLERVLERRQARARERERRERWVEESALHPYVRHWTSPIDLHDGVSNGRMLSERGRRRQQGAGMV